MADLPGQYLDNVLEQPEILRSLIARLQTQHWAMELEAHWRTLQHLPILMTGMGASYGALWPLWFYVNRKGLIAQKIETSELIHYLPNVLERPGLCLVISQSGESIEIQRLAQQIHDNRSRGLKTPIVVSVTTAPGNYLSQHSDVALHTCAGAEVGVATKTFTSTLALLHLLGRCLTGELTSQTYREVDSLASHQTDLLAHWQDWITPAYQHLKAAETYALVGRGPTQAAVDDGALVLKESLRRLAHGFTGGEFRHGPMEMLNPTLGVLIFHTPSSTLKLNQRLSADVANRGGSLVTIGQPIDSFKGVHLMLPEVQHDLMPILEILPIQLFAHLVAQSLGLIPGNFQWNGKVVLQE